MNNYFTYIIESINFGKYYIGHTNNTEQRLKSHNNGKNKATKPYLPWKYIYKKDFQSRSDATKHELYLKSIKNRKLLKKIIDAG